MKFTLKVLGIFLVFNMMGYCSEFNQKSFEGMGRDFIHSEVQGKYMAIIGSEFPYSPEDVKEFRLEGGVDVRINAKGLELIDQLDGRIPPKLDGLILGADYQSYQIMEGNEETVSLRQIYGKKCPERFFNADREALTFSIVYSIPSFLIKEKSYQIIITKVFIAEGNRSYIENILLNHRSELVIRHLNPKNTDNDYALFIVNLNRYSLQHDSESLVAEFTSSPVSSF